MGMMGDLFRDFHAILEIGVEGNVHSPSTTLSYRYVKVLPIFNVISMLTWRPQFPSCRQRKYHQLFRQLLAVAPWIIDEMASLGPKGVLQVARGVSLFTLSSHRTAL